MPNPVSINAVCDYIIFRMKKDDDSPLSNLKLQKLLYYTQAWNLAFFGEPLFHGKFQAWIHGPVNREIFDRFRLTKTIYSEVLIEDIQDINFSGLSDANKALVDNVLEVYADYSGVQLEYMTHHEQPWVEARQGFAPTDRCENDINEGLMRDYYRSRSSK